MDPELEEEQEKSSNPSDSFAEDIVEIELGPDPLKPSEEDLSRLGNELNRNSKASSSSQMGSSEPIQMLSAPTQADDVAIMSNILGIKMGQGPPIPQIIHRFWTGGPMTDEAMRILEDQAKKTEGTAWQNIFWRSGFIDAKYLSGLDAKKLDKIEQQRLQLMKWGYDIRAIEELASADDVTIEDLRKAAELAYEPLTIPGDPSPFGGLVLYSDLARILYLERLGGHHMDIDIGLGNMDMNQQYHHNDERGEIPLFGMIARDNRAEDTSKLLALARELQGKVNTENDLGSYEVAAEHITNAATSAGVGFAQIASAAETENLKEALEFMLKSIRREEDPYLQVGTRAPNYLLGFSDKEVDPSLMDQRLKLTIPPYLLRLEHLTQESDNQT